MLTETLFWIQNIVLSIRRDRATFEHGPFFQSKFILFILSVERLLIFLKYYLVLLVKESQTNIVGACHVSEPIQPLNGKPSFCLLKNKFSCHQHGSTQISVWLIEAVSVPVSFYTHTKMAVIFICLLLTGCLCSPLLLI